MKKSQPIGVCALLFNPDGEILLGKRKNSYKAGFYGLPGGRIELNEPIEIAIKREVEEETGLKLNKLEYLGVVRENQGDYDFIHFIYVVKNISMQPILCEPEKCESWIWLDKKKLKDNILPGHRAAIKMYYDGEVITDQTL